MRRIGIALIAASLALAGAAVLAVAQQSTYQRFFVHCAISHQSQNDPIVNPGQAGGAAHLHEFFGSTITNHDPSYQRMIANDSTTCGHSGDIAAYWVPAIRHIGTGELAHATTVRAYYAASFNGPQQNEITPYPRGFSLVSDDFHWFCGNTQRLPSPPDCTGTGKTLGLGIDFLNVCWDGSIPGRNAGANWAATVTPLGSDGECEEGERQLPKLRLEVRFAVVDGTQYEIATEPGRVAHGDFWNTWKQGVLIDLVEECLQPESPDCKVVSD
jgi:hypothetical protein